MKRANSLLRLVRREISPKLKLWRNRKDDLLGMCQRLNLSNSFLIAETAFQMIKKLGFGARKHVMMKHKAAAIYSSCRIHSYEITANEIVTSLQVPGKHLSTFCLKFYKKCNGSNPISSQFILTPITPADLSDLEASSIIPPNSAEQFHRICVDLDELFPGGLTPAVTKRHSAYFKRHSRYRLAVFVNMAHLFLYQEELREGSVLKAGVLPCRLSCFQRDVRRSWDILHASCFMYMRDVIGSFSPAKMTKERSRKHVSKLLGTLLERKDTVKESLARYCDYGCPAVRLSGPAHQKSKLKKEQKKKSIPVDNSIVNDMALNQCLVILRQYIVLHSEDDIRQRFTKLLTILSLTDIKPHLEKSTKILYFVLLHQILLALEPKVPPLSALLKDKAKSSYMDKLVRLTFLKTFRSFEPYLLPTNLDKEKLSSTIHTYLMQLIGVSRTYNCLISTMSACPNPSPQLPLRADNTTVLFNILSPRSPSTSSLSSSFSSSSLSSSSSTLSSYPTFTPPYSHLPSPASSSSSSAGFSTENVQFVVPLEQIIRVLEAEQSAM